MATVTTASIIERAGILLDDMTHVGWTEDELLKWLNDGQREIVHSSQRQIPRPRSCQGRRHQQTLPADGVALIDISRNFAADGTTPGAQCGPSSALNSTRTCLTGTTRPPRWMRCTTPTTGRTPKSSMSIRRRTRSESSRSSMAQARQMQRW